MSIELYLAFVAATVVLILIPGPNVALIVANSVAHGARHGLVTVAGTSAAMVIQLSLTILGLSGFLALMASWFEWLRWLGVAYLLYLGIAALTAPSTDLTTVKPTQSAPARMFLRGFLVSLTNPKTLLFYSAFLPQFVSPGADTTTQLMILAATFLAIAVVLDGAWALLASRARRFLSLNGRLRNRITGAFFLSAAAGLALARKP
jgi:threonine/homoserine/homoserine lactone efflux protein